MLKVYRLMMESCKFFVILLLYCVTAAYCYPPKPLDERMPSGITWQAWLLVNDDNQSKQQTNADGMLRRRITPKSVFFAPTFDPESLPPCSDGYSSDMKGACVPIIKFDEDAHYEFLIQKLKDKLGPVDYDYDDDPTEAPLKLDIPLQPAAEEEDDGETSAAILISPTKMLGMDKRDGTEDEKKQETFLKKLAAATTKKSEETTTTVTEPITELGNEKASTLTEDLTAATEPLTTTEDITTRTESHNTKRSTDDAERTTTEEDVETTTIFDLTTNGDLTTTPPPKVRVAVSEPQAHNSFKFPEETVTQKSIKFPDADVSYRTQIPSSVETNPGTRGFSNDAPFSQPAETLVVGDRKVVFRDQSQPEEANLDYSNGVKHLLATTAPPSFNRRNRDRSDGMFLLPPRWNQPNFQKPLVLRFSRKHAYLDEARFKRPDFYRAVPMDDFAYLFSKHRLSGHR